MTKHTKGPWTVSEQFEGTQVKISGPEGWLCVALAYGDTNEEAQANARLIAAAPKLLETLKELYANWREYVDTPNDWEELNEQVESAIRKAKGE